MIELLQDILAEQFDVASSQVQLISTEVHSDGPIQGFEVRGLEVPTFIYTQVGTSEWKDAEYQIHLPELEIWLRMWRFPNDPYLHGLSMLGIKTALSHLLEKLDSKLRLLEVTNVSYRPGKRAVFRVRTNHGVLFAKSMSKKNTHRAISIQSLIESKINTAELLGVANDDILFFREVHGKNFLDMPRSSIPKVAHSVLEVERSFANIDCDLQAKRKVVSNIDWYLGLLKESVSKEFHRHLLDIAQSTSKIEFQGRQKFIHGDFHLGQFKFQDPSTVAILDFDNAGMGHIEEDQGALLANCLFAEMLNRGNQATFHYVDFLGPLLTELAQTGQLSAIRGIASRHLIAYLATFLGQIRAEAPRYLDLLMALQEDDERFLIWASSLPHEPV